MLSNLVKLNFSLSQRKAFTKRLDHNEQLKMLKLVQWLARNGALRWTFKQIHL